MGRKKMSELTYMEAIEVTDALRNPMATIKQGLQVCGVFQIRNTN